MWISFWGRLPSAHLDGWQIGWSRFSVSECWMPCRVLCCPQCALLSIWAFSCRFGPVQAVARQTRPLQAIQANFLASCPLLRPFWPLSCHFCPFSGLCAPPFRTCSGHSAPVVVGAARSFIWPLFFGHYLVGCLAISENFYFFGTFIFGLVCPFGISPLTLTQNCTHRRKGGPGRWGGGGDGGGVNGV